MAVKMINADTLRAALGADATLQARVDSIHKAACARVKRYALGAPVEVRNEAVVLLAAWIYQATAQSRNVFPADQEGPPINVSAAFRNSGAQGLLSPWRVNRARGRVGDALALAVVNVPPSSIGRVLPTRS